VKGKAWKFGDDVNTDEIIPARYLNTTDPGELARHVMEDADADFAKKMNPGDIIVAGANFGCGSSREHAPIAIKAAGISCVIAKTFARIFFRNSINIGLLIIEQARAADEIKEGDEVEVLLDDSKIINHASGKEYRFQRFPEELQRIIEVGGLMNFVKTRLG
jgi:3-isopropylmalate/(R)-2-methylmalate dehydratase small subunit